MSGLDSLRGSRHPKITTAPTRGDAGLTQRYRVLHTDLKRFINFKKKNIVKSYIRQESLKPYSRRFKKTSNNFSLAVAKKNYKLALTINQRAGVLYLNHTKIRNYLKLYGPHLRWGLSRLKSTRKIRHANALTLMGAYRRLIIQDITKQYTNYIIWAPNDYLK